MNLEEIKKAFQELTEEERLEVISLCCRYCGGLKEKGELCACTMDD